MAESSINHNQLVSVIVRTYNQEDYIFNTLQSVLNQNYSNIQIIVVNDNSTDNTEAIIKSLIKEHPGKITYFSSKENRGELRTFNKGLSLVKGDYVALLDGDDYYFPDKINKQVAFLNKNQNVAVCYHNVAVFSQNAMDPIFYWSDRFIPRSGKTGVVARFGHFPCAVSVMMRRKFMPDEGHNELLTTQGDWLYLVDVLENSNGDIQYMDQVLAGYRIHQNNISGNWQDKFESRFKSVEIGSQKHPGLRQKFAYYFAEMLFLKFLYCIAAKQMKPAFRSLIMSLIKSFPKFLIILRIPLREIRFLLKKRLKNDKFISNFLKYN